MSLSGLYEGLHERLEQQAAEIERLLAAHTEIIQKYEKIMRDPPDWTTFTGPDDPRLVFAREAWFGAAQISRKVLSLEQKPDNA